MTPTHRSAGWVIAIAVVGFVAVFQFVPSQGAGTSRQWLLSGVYAIGLGVVFLCAYVFEQASFVFRWIIWLCEHFSYPPTRKMALFYAALAGVMGALAILQGLGAIDLARRA